MDGGSGGEGNEREQRDEELSRFHQEMMVMSRVGTRDTCVPDGDVLQRRGGRASAVEWRERRKRRGGSGGESITRRWV
jgi:hypothetical protein